MAWPLWYIQSKAKWKKSPEKNEFPDNMRFIVLASYRSHETELFGKHRKKADI